MKTYTVGIIGCGRIASLLEQEPERETPNTHAGCYDTCDRTRIVVAADASDERRVAFGQRCDVSSMYGDWREMLEKEQLDIVSICTYPVPHRDMVVAAAESGAKAIFCEKSMAVTLHQADEMIDVCEKHGVRLSINHGRRWDWQYRKIGELLDQKTIGDLQAMVLNYTAGLANNGTHFFDMLRYFAGNVAWAVGRLLDPGALDPKGSGLFHFTNGVDCIVNGINGKNARYLFELIGSEGRIAVTGDRGPKFELSIGGNRSPKRLLTRKSTRLETDDVSSLSLSKKSSKAWMRVRTPYQPAATRWRWCFHFTNRRNEVMGGSTFRWRAVTLRYL